VAWLRCASCLGALCSVAAVGIASAQTGPYVPPTPGSAGAISPTPLTPGTPGTVTSTPATSSVREAFGVTEDARPSPWTATIGLQETYTNNVNLNPSNVAKSAFVTEVTPYLGLRYNGPRAALIGDVSLPVVIYLPSDAANDKVYPTVNLLGDLTLVDDFLYLEGAVNVSQQFLSPFGAQPVSLANATDNRYRSIVYRISPFIKGRTGAGTEYQLRNDNVWTNLSGAPINTNNAHYTNFNAYAVNTQTTLGWRASLDYSDVHFDNDQPSTVTQLYRGTGIYTATEALQLSASAGWEQNEFQFTSSQDVIYGVGFVWRPSPVTRASADWDHRYFGSSYRVLLEHTTPLSEWRFDASRNVTTYPQQIASLPSGINVAAFLNALFLPAFADATQRQQFVEQLIRDRGLPASLASPVNLYTNQTLLQQSYLASVALLGARNTVLLSAFWVKNQPITANGTPLPPLLSLGNDNTQTGGTVVWTHKLAPSINLVSSLEALRTVDNGGAGGVLAGSTTRQGAVRLGISSPITPQTTVYAGARYQTLQSDVAQDYTEAAGFVGLTYTFR
jgi:uncharacterized protein (PEP-CTERM system associated)